MSTEEAIKEVFESRSMLLKIGYNNDQAKNYRKRYKEGTVSMDKIHEILVKAGYRMVIEPVWIREEALKIDPKEAENMISEEKLDAIYKEICNIKASIEMAMVNLQISKGKRPRKNQVN